MVFYTTESIELAKEWACGDGHNGFANSYELDTEGLRIPDPDSGKYDILNWLALLTGYRSSRSEDVVPRQSKIDIIKTLIKAPH